MPRLVVTRPGHDSTEFPLVPGIARVGRAPECEVMIDDPGVSRLHATIEVREDGVVLEDAGSRNGITVDNSPIRSARLTDGMRFRIGESVMVEFRDGTPGAPAAPYAGPPPARGGPSPTVPRPVPAARGASAPPPPPPPVRNFATSPPPAARPEPPLVPAPHVTPATESRLPAWFRRPRPSMWLDDGRRIAWERLSVLVGRDPTCAVRIDNDSVSRLHARLDRVGDRVFVVDLKSANGTLVNGRPVQREEVREGDRVTWGELSATFHWSSAASATRVAIAVVGILLFLTVILLLLRP